MSDINLGDDKVDKNGTVNPKMLNDRIREFREIINNKYCEFDRIDINPDSSQSVTLFATMKPLNASDAIDKLAEAEQLLLKKDAISLIKAEKLFFEARHAWHKAIISTNSNMFGYAVIVIELLYLLMIIVFYYTYKNSLQSISYNDFENKITHSMFLQVPIIVYVWGFIGGATWCAYSACYWMKRRMFDRAYVVWYVFHPFVSSFLGAIASVLILGGVETFSRPEADNSTNLQFTQTLSRPLICLLILTSFIAGFSANNIWKTIENYVKKAFGDKPRAKNTIL